MIKRQSPRADTDCSGKWIWRMKAAYFVILVEMINRIPIILQRQVESEKIPQGIFFSEKHFHNAKGFLTIFQFSLNVFTESAVFSDKNMCHYSKGFKCATFCVGDQDVTTAPARHTWETGSLNGHQFMLQWFIRFGEFNEFLFHWGKTPFSI